MLHHQVASLIVKCWMYLVWMRLIETDQAPVGAAIRDQILWSLMRPFESAHSTKATLSHRDNRHAKGKVKQGMKLVSLLLCHYPLLQRFVTLGNISTNALVTLPQEQLSVSTLCSLVDKLEGAGHTVSKNNIQALPQQAFVSSIHTEHRHASSTSAAAAALDLAMLSQALSSADDEIYVRRSSRHLPLSDQGNVVASSDHADVDTNAHTTTIFRIPIAPPRPQHPSHSHPSTVAPTHPHRPWVRYDPWRKFAV